MSRPAYILRALIRNDEALVEHYNGVVQGEFEITAGHRCAVLVRRAQVIARLNARRDELATLSPASEPTATKSHRTADSGPELQPYGNTHRPDAGETISHVEV